MIWACIYTLVNPYTWLCDCVALVPAQGSVWPRCCWRNWVLWPAGGWNGVLPGGPVDTRNRDNTAVSTTHTHLYTLLTFPQNHRRDTLSTARWAPPVSQPECVGPPPVQSQKGALLSPQRGKIQFCNSTAPFFLFFHTLSDHLSTALPAMWFATLQYEQTIIFGPMAKCVSQDKKKQATVNQWANSFLKSTIRMHICFLALKRERKVTIVNIDLWKGRWKALFKKKKEKRPDTKHKSLESYSNAHANQKNLDWNLFKF